MNLIKTLFIIFCALFFLGVTPSPSPAPLKNHPKSICSVPVNQIKDVRVKMRFVKLKKKAGCP